MEKGITTPRIYQYWIYHNTVIRTCFDMLSSSKHDKWYRVRNLFYADDLCLLFLIKSYFGLSQDVIKN